MTRVFRSAPRMPTPSVTGGHRILINLAIYAGTFAIGAVGGAMFFMSGRAIQPPVFATVADLPTATGGPVRVPTPEEVQARAMAKDAEAPFVAAGRQALLRPCDEAQRQAAIQAGNAFAVLSGKAIQVGLAKRGPESRFDAVSISMNDPVWSGLDGVFEPGRQRDGAGMMLALLTVGHISPGEFSRQDRSASLYVGQLFVSPSGAARTSGDITPYCQATRGGQKLRRPAPF